MSSFLTSSSAILKSRAALRNSDDDFTLAIPTSYSLLLRTTFLRHSTTTAMANAAARIHPCSIRVVISVCSKVGPIVSHQRLIALAAAHSPPATTLPMTKLKYGD